MSVEQLLGGRVRLYCGDSVAAMQTMEDNSVDSVCCDPPYHFHSIVKRFANSPRSERTENSENPFGRTGRGFMGMQWDGGDIAFQPELWAEVLRVLKPGGHVAAFGASRGYHRMACAIEDAGFEVRDSFLNAVDPASPVVAFMQTLDDEQRGAFLRCLDDAGFGGLLAWMYGTGFPKSHDVALDFETTLCERVTNAEGANEWRYKSDGALLVRGEWRHPLAEQWQGWGTALKPAFEPIVLARKPLSEETVAANVERWGTGALNVDACRIESEGGSPREGEASQTRRYSTSGSTNFAALPGPRGGDPKGRFPANVIHDGSTTVVDAFPAEAGAFAPVHKRNGDKFRNTYGPFKGNIDEAGSTFQGDTGSAARFFFSPKATAEDRVGSRHPTVKRVDSIQWLIRLITPPGGVVLDQFAGTGTTGEAAFREGMSAILVEREPIYQGDIRRRMKLVLSGPDERARESIKAKLVDQKIDLGPLFEGAAV